jgi:hypothetical protein
MAASAASGVSGAMKPLVDLGFDFSAIDCSSNI